MKKTLYFGGSFNPIHNGHLICCRAAAENAGYARVVLIPAAMPWQKAKAEGVATAAHRFAMCQLAVAGIPLFEVDPIEINRNDESYTVDTARALLERGHESVDWLIGADTLTRLSTWHDAATLFQLVQFRVMQRPGTTLDFSAIPAGCRATPLVTPAIDISATDIRRRIASGLPIDFLTPEPVVRYIAEHGLYRTP